jgi:hypothetical protein
MEQGIEEIGHTGKERRTEKICRKVDPKQKDDQQYNEIEGTEEGEESTDHGETKGQAYLGRVCLGIQDL